MALLRTEVGDRAIIVATQELPDGAVRMTGAIGSHDLDHAALLAPVETLPCEEGLRAVVAHDELPGPLARTAARGGTPGRGRPDRRSLWPKRCPRRGEPHQPGGEPGWFA